MTEQKKSPTVKMRVNIAGYGGSAVSLFAAYDSATEMLLIAKESELETIDRADFLKITNQKREEHFDGVFSEDETKDAINAFFELEALRLLTLGQSAARCNPTSRIERSGMDEHGMVYRIHPDISNGQVAVMAAALYASKQRNIRVAQSFMAAMADMKMETI